MRAPMQRGPYIGDDLRQKRGSKCRKSYGLFRRLQGADLATRLTENGPAFRGAISFDAV